jgi:DNA (cytosine-5)-methyltransferase 1
VNVLSLFAGIGGLDLGLERASMTVVGQVEIDPFCQRVLAKHWPEVPRHDDVRTAVRWWLGESRPAVDVVCGGFPCQPVSLAGRGLAQADERWLWPAAHAVIRDLRPRFAVLENVPGLLGRGLGDVLGDLAEIGYDAEWDCVPASAVGAPHRRDRVFIVAYPSREPRRLQPESEPGRRDQAVAGVDGTTWPVADTASQGRRSTFDTDAPSRAGALERRQAMPGGRRRDVAHADRQRQLQPCGGFGQEWRRPGDSGWWTTEPDVGRVAHGVPARMDRLRALGNAVVPQVAEHIGRIVMGAAT